MLDDLVIDDPDDLRQRLVEPSLDLQPVQYNDSDFEHTITGVLLCKIIFCGIVSC